jgi:molecular chaperone HtpG
MNQLSNKIPFTVEINRMVELLATQIYPTPFALLRENVQNSFDAILLRKYSGQIFEPKIEVTIEPQRVIVLDNGIGMSQDDLRNHFWRAGSSSKNTQDARAAGVVGTFGIGAMANFGIAEELFVETESAITGERTRCSATKSTLSTTENCISFETIKTTGNPGTILTATTQSNKTINVVEAENYISRFVSFLNIEVWAMGKTQVDNP